MTKHMLSGAAGVGLLFAALLVGGASGLDLGLTVAQDVWEYSDSLVKPASVLLGVDFPLGAMAHMRVRAGYSGWFDFSASMNASECGQAEYHGVRVDAAPLLRVPVWTLPLYVSTGVGVGGRFAFEQSSTGAYGWREIISDRTVTAIDQTFMMGVGFDISRRLALDFEIERPGFSASYEHRRRYMYDTGVTEPTILSSDDQVHVGWRGDARTGIGATLRVKL